MDHRDANPPVLARAIAPDALSYAVLATPSNPLRLESLAPRLAGWDGLLTLVICVVGPYAPRFLMGFFTPEQGFELENVGGVVVILKWIELLVAASLALYLVRRGNIAAAGLGLRLDGVGRQIAWGLAGLAAAYLYMFLTVVGVLLLPESAQKQLGGDLQDRLDFVEALPVDDLFLTLALLIPVALQEELVFRSLLLPLLRRASGSWAIAFALSAGLFGALHIAQGMFAIVQITGLGLIFSVIFVRSRSLLAVAIAHFLFNFAQFQLMRLVPWLIQTQEAAAQS